MKRLLCATALFAALPAAAAPPTVGAVQGVVVPPATVEAPASQHLGFLPLIENPIVELRQYDALPECFVYLEGGPAAPDASKPSQATWQLNNHSFSPPLLPVVVGSPVEIAIVGKESHRLFAPGHDDLLPLEPIGSSTTFNVPGQGEVVRVVSRSSPHLEGRVVPLPTRYFSRLDRNGRFKIDNVPAGRWTLRVWYHDGWSAYPGKQVDAPIKDVRIDLTNDALSGKGAPLAPPTPPTPAPEAPAAPGPQ